MKNEAELEAYLRPYRFDLPEEFIARRPAARRDGSRLLVMDRASGRLSDRMFKDLPELLRSGDLLIRNVTRVSPRRIHLRRASGARIEALFLEQAEDDTEGGGTSRWNCLVKNARKIKNNEILISPDPALAFRFSRSDAESTSAAADSAQSFRLTALTPTETPAWKSAAEAELFFERYGAMPLPPYLKRAAEADDRERYQTVYAHPTTDATASVAAPTAGLHFTPELFDSLKQNGVGTAELELLISYGTFAPLEPGNFARNALHPESYRIGEDFPAAPWNGSAPPDETPGRRIAIGTTSLRALEDNLRRHGEIRAGTFETRLFLKPPDVCHSTEGLLTNFHLPGSSLLLLVCVFGGVDRVLAAYRHAIAEKYRFYSYGDAMLIL